MLDFAQLLLDTLKHEQFCYCSQANKSCNVSYLLCTSNTFFLCPVEQQKNLCPPETVGKYPELPKNVSETLGQSRLKLMDLREVNSMQLHVEDYADVFLADLGESYPCFHRCPPLFRSMIMISSFVHVTSLYTNRGC